MKLQWFKTWSLPIIAVGLLAFLITQQPAVAAPPPQEDEAVASNVAEEDGVTLEKTVSGSVALIGYVTHYTVTITNDSDETVNPTLEDVIPAQMVLRADLITATQGETSSDENIVTWTGELAAGDEVIITYGAIPPSMTAEAGQDIVNVANLTFADTSLVVQSGVTIEHEEYGYLWSFFRPFVNFLALALINLDLFLEGANVPYAFGFAIILFTVIVRALTFPLNVQQIKSAKGMQELQPKLKELQEKYKDDREGLAMAQMTLYREAGINPLGGCLPMIVQMPIWISLYWALIQLSQEGLLSEGFFWIPSLAGPVAYDQGNISWLYPFPPAIGWGPALSYLVLPVLLVVSQYFMTQMLSPPASDPQQAQMQSMMKFMPLMFGFFALIVPAGLTLYWFTSNSLMMVQQYFTRTHLNQPATATAGSGLNAPVPSTDPKVTSSSDTKSNQGTKKNNAKSKRRSRRKR